MKITRNLSEEQAEPVIKTLEHNWSAEKNLRSEGRDRIIRQCTNNSEPRIDWLGW